MLPGRAHSNEDEILFIHRGEGIVVVGDKRYEAKEGTTVFVPKGTWHAVENRDKSKPVDMLWIFSQPGMDDFFRELSVPFGAAPRQYSQHEIDEADRKHGMRRKL